MKSVFTGSIVPGVFALLAASASASVTLPGAHLRGSTEKPALGYKVGEEMVFTLRLEGLKGELPEGCRVKWFREGDDGKREEGFAPVPLAEPMLYRTSLPCPGFVRLVAWVVDKNGEKALSDDPNARDLSAPVGFDGGAGVEPEKLASYPEPADFDAFWNRRKAELADVPIRELSRVEVSSGRPDVKQYAVTVTCAGPRPVTGFLAIPVVALEKGRRFPAVLDFEGYGERIPAPPHKPGGGCISFRLNAFGYELVGKDRQYYRDFFKSLMRGGKRYALSAEDHPDPETAYFGGMSWRVMRALEYLRTLPEWDGRGLEVSGGSQAGMQSLWAAGLDPHVTSARIAFPWCCDMGGQAKLRGAKKQWGVEWTEAMGYYDPVNMAKRISCPVTLSRAGLGDYTCPPSGIAVLWNNLRCKKSFTWMQESTHGYVPPDPKQTWTWTAEAQTARNVTVRPADDGRILTNPDCGWAMHYYDNGAKYGTTIATGDALAWYPGCSVVYLRLPWSWLEPEEGVYNWQAIDTPAQQWIARGGQIAFRITVSETMKDGATPKWMLTSGAKIIRWNWREGPKPDGVFWECAPDDPIFLEKFGNFLKAFAARYDGRKEVAFVDVGSLGIWGEGHTARTIRLSEADTDRIAKLQTELHLKHFKKTLVVVNDDFTIGARMAQKSPMMDWALAQGLGWRDDSILCASPNDKSWSEGQWWYHEAQGRAFSERAPVVLEFGHYGVIKSRGFWNVEKLVEAVEKHHASYLSIHGDPKPIFTENKKLVEQLAKRLGYRFQAREVEYPSVISASSTNAVPFDVRFAFANAGVARCYRDAFPCLTLKTKTGGIAAVLTDADFNLKTLAPAEPGKAEAKSHTASFTLGRWQAPILPPGAYKVYLSVGEADGTPVYELPMAGDDGQRRYLIGAITCSATSGFDVVNADTGAALRTEVARCSTVPFNVRWPGHQRTLDQTEICHFVRLDSAGPVRLSVTADCDFKTALVRPLSRGGRVTATGRRLDVSLPGPGQYSLELDGKHRNLMIFVDAPKDYGVKPTDTATRYFGPGEHVVGLLRLTAEETVYLDEGAVVYGRIEARDADGIRILGRGILDASRVKEEPIAISPELEREQRAKGFAITNVKRHDAIRLEYCDRVEIDGITIRDSCAYNIRPVCCRDVTINNVKIVGQWRYNSDGIDMHNCERVRISNSFVRTFDDSICVKGIDYVQKESDMLHDGYLHDAFRDIVVSNCVVWCDWGRSLELGAEMRAKEICNVRFTDCDVIHPTHNALDIQNVDYADVHDIVYENIRVEMDEKGAKPSIQKNDGDRYTDLSNGTYLPPVMSALVLYIAEYSKPGTRGQIHDVTFRDIAITAPRMPTSLFKGFDEAHRVRGVTMENISLNARRLAPTEIPVDCLGHADPVNFK